MIKIENLVWSIRSTLSDSKRFHLILQNHIQWSDWALPMIDFPTDLSNHQMIGQWDTRLKISQSRRGNMKHRHTHNPQTYVRRLWLIVLVNLGYSFSVHAWLPLCVAMSEYCEEPGCSFQTLEDRWLVTVITWLDSCTNLQVNITWSITASMH